MRPFPHAEPFFTSIVDLCLVEIRRAKDKDFVTVTILDAPSYQDTEKFSSFYDSFSNSKNLENANKQKFRELVKNSALVLSASSVERENRIWLSVHAYICHGQRARGA